MNFDPDAAAPPGAGVFGLPHKRDDARIILMPVPFDATTSYRSGTAAGPEAIRAASSQVDLYDLQFGAVYEQGVWMAPHNEEIARLSKRARKLATPIIDKGGPDDKDADAMKQIAAAGEHVADVVHHHTLRVLREGKIPGLVGGDHASPLGAIRACAEKHHRTDGGIGLLMIDAHLDLREAYEGFAYSHASIMHNVMSTVEDVSRLVAVGIRDVGRRELEVVERSDGRIICCADHDWANRLDAGESFRALCEEAVRALPQHVYISFDIDGLDPALCPATGTPVPGGLSFHQASTLLETVRRSGRRIVGFDLCEVRPSPAGADDWDANVGARILYKLCGAAAPAEET